MKHWDRLGLVLTAAALLGAPTAALAQPRSRPGPSHRAYIPIAPAGDLEQILKDNLDRVRGLNDMRDILEQLRKNSDLLKGSGFEDFLKGLDGNGAGLDPNDPKTRKMFQDVWDRLNKDPELRDKVQKNLSLDPKKFQELADQARKELANDQRPEGEPAVPGKPQPAPEAPTPPAAEDISPPDNDHDFAQTLKNWLERAENWGRVGEMLRDSPAFQKAVNDLSLNFLNQEGGTLHLDGGMLNRVGDVADLAGRGFDMVDRGWSSFGNLPMPSLPSVRLPNLSLGRFPSFGMPSVGAPGGGGAGLGTALLWVVLAAALGLILWQVLARVSLRQAGKQAGAGWRLGPWPVDPAQVTTRQELIQAFEYVSLLLLGPAVRTWNHREIAAGLADEAAGGSSGKRAAADRLAALYEVARYAPEEGPLAGEALAQARRHLCYLAGVAAA
jgi:hypothetical protein